MLLFIEMSVKHAIRFPNFNTSHVTVYRNSWYRPTHERIFQYISCYCLSLPFLCICRILFQFQYISCYCLSSTVSPLLVPQFYFNTSHVTVYHKYHFACYSIFYISIHLMLLFIKGITVFGQINIYFNTSHVTVYHVAIFVHTIQQIFQYISCYCLSNELTPFYIFLRI